MSDKELAHSLIDELPAEYLQAAIVMLAKLSKGKMEQADLEKRRKAYEKIMTILKPAPPDFDPDEARDEYYKEKYGL